MRPDYGAAPLDMYSNLPILKFDVDPQNPLHLLGIEQQAVSGPAEASAVSTDGGATWTEIPYAAGMQGQFPSSVSQQSTSGHQTQTAHSHAETLASRGCPQ